MGTIATLTPQPGQLYLKGSFYLYPFLCSLIIPSSESSPALHLITETDEERFVFKCCPGLSLEEFNVFKAVLMMEEVEEDPEDDEELEYDDDDRESNTYTVPSKGTKIKYKK